LGREAKPFLAFAQGFFGPLAVGDVEVSANAADGIAVLVALDLRPARDPANLAIVGADDAEFASVVIIDIERVDNPAEPSVAVVRMDDPHPMLERQVDRAG